ncbi:MAG TPA: hypothetical protein VI479_18120 [Blastocatellia bacterium]
MDKAVRMDWDNLHSLYDAARDETVKELIETEQDLKYLKKYASLCQLMPAYGRLNDGFTAFQRNWTCPQKSKLPS